jgi:hypothetical protein
MAVLWRAVVGRGASESARAVKAMPAQVERVAPRLRTHLKYDMVESSHLERGYQLFRVLLRVDRPDCLNDAPVRTYYVRDALGILRGRRIARVVCQPDLSLRIAKQLEREVEFFCKGPVLFLRVEADAEYLGIFIAVLLDSVTESNAFGCSAGRVCFRVKPEYDRAAFEVAQAHVFAGVRFHGEIRRFVSYFKHGFCSFDCVGNQLKNSLDARNKSSRVRSRGDVSLVVADDIT